MARPEDVDATAARDHAQQLLNWGMSRPALAVASGLSLADLCDLLAGAAKIHPAAAERILAVPPDLAAVPDGHVICARGTIRRLQALAFMGWETAEISHRTGVSRPTLSAIRAGRRPGVNITTARRVAQAYELLAMQPGPDRLTALEAREQGWAPPLAWDDIDEEDGQLPLEPAAEVLDEVALQRAMAGQSAATGSTRIEAVRRLTEAGESAATIAGLLGVSSRTVQRLRTAHNIGRRHLDTAGRVA